MTLVCDQCLSMVCQVYQCCLEIWGHPHTLPAQLLMMYTLACNGLFHTQKRHFISLAWQSLFGWGREPPHLWHWLLLTSPESVICGFDLRLFPFWDLLPSCFPLNTIDRTCISSHSCCFTSSLCLAFQLLYQAYNLAAYVQKVICPPTLRRVRP